MQSVCSEVHLAAKDAGLELRRAVPAVAECVENRLETCKEKHVGCCVTGKILLKPKITRFIPKVAFFEELQIRGRYVIVICPRGKTVDGIDDEIKIIQQREAGPDWLCGRCKNCQKLIERDGQALELAA